MLEQHRPGAPLKSPPPGSITQVLGEDKGAVLVDVGRRAHLLQGPLDEAAPQSKRKPHTCLKNQHRTQGTITMPPIEHLSRIGSKEQVNLLHPSRKGQPYGLGL